MRITSVDLLPMPDSGLKAIKMAKLEPVMHFLNN